jgi:hypothetical protein
MSRSLNPGSSGHSVMPRGLAAGAIDGVRNGRFDRLFAPTKTRKPADEWLQTLAKFMVTSFDDNGEADADKGKAINEAEPADENATINAAYTYLGQFVDHDITLDTTGFGQSQKDVSATIDFRTPALDLDCIYGGGPADQPSIYRNAKNGARHLLRLGAPISGAGPGMIRQDLLRLPAVSETDSAQLALIGDKRNDENKIVAQFQATMIALHNKIYEDDEFHPGIADPNDRFTNTVKLVRWHYQWVVLKDFLLERLLTPNAINGFGSIYHPHLSFYDSVYYKGRDFPFMPVEFSGAVYRFGHSMVRPSYSLSAGEGKEKKGDNPRVPTFGKQGEDLRGFGEAITKDWVIDWGYFVDGVAPTSPKPDSVLPQPSYRIDTRVGNPLANLPEFASLQGAQAIQANLAYRNLSRSVGLALATGEEVAHALNITALTTAEIWSAGSAVYKDDGPKSEIISRREAIKMHGFAEYFAGRTPLWFYILREAEFFGHTRSLPAAYLKFITDKPSAEQENKNFGGQHLGPVGSRIVLETFLGLLWHDRRSFLHDSTWRPHAKINIGGGDFSLGKLISYALS